MNIKAAGSNTRTQLIEKAAAALGALYDEMLQAGKAIEHELHGVNPEYRSSAQNLSDYMVLRRHDLRELQTWLAELGLSSLGRAEAHTLATVEAVLTTLHALNGKVLPATTQSSASPNYGEGKQMLARHTQLLLGEIPHERSVHIMVTMPREACSNYQLVHDLVQSGMNCMRINCAYGNDSEWLKIIEHLRSAERALKRRCKILMDLAGPKLRTGPLVPGPKVIKVRPQRDGLGRVLQAARIWLTADATINAPGAAAAILPVTAAWLATLTVGETVRVVDARGAERALHIVATETNGCWAELQRAAYFVPGMQLRVMRGEHSAESEGVIGDLPASENAILLRPGDGLIVTRDLVPGHAAILDENGNVICAATIGCTLPAAFDHLKRGEPVWLDDGKIGGHIEKIEADRIYLRIEHTRVGGTKLRADKGINFPESDLRLPALTDEDKINLRFVLNHADIVALSFANTRDDVELLLADIAAYKTYDIGLVLKIETQRGFSNLPEMLLAAMKNSACGIMIARGDLAVECGFERLAEVQEEILWICEAAHIPVIWATQVLESLAKEGMPSRAEVTDAAMSTRAECVMLNKGPYIVTAVTALDDILRRMQTHHSKKSAMLRELKLAHHFSAK